MTKAFTAAWAPPSLVEVGRMIATGPNFGFRKWVGSGMIRFACSVSPFGDSGSVSPWASWRAVNVTEEFFFRPSCKAHIVHGGNAGISFMNMTKLKHESPAPYVDYYARRILY